MLFRFSGLILKCYSTLGKNHQVWSFHLSVTISYTKIHFPQAKALYESQFGYQ